MKIPIKDNNRRRINQINDSNNNGGNVLEKQRMFLNSESLLKYFLGTDEHIDTLIKCRGSQFDLLTYDYNLYEALASLEKYDNFQISRVVKLLEVVKVLPYEDSHNKKKSIISYKRVEELRKKALSTRDKQK